MKRQLPQTWNDKKIDSNEKQKDGMNEMSLSLSLKRFKISTTPGELRLTKDIEDIQMEFHWYHQGNSKRLISPDQRTSLERDLVDPLRICIRLIHFEFFIQFPRLYPHASPVVYRITRCFGKLFLKFSFSFVMYLIFCLTKYLSIENTWNLKDNEESYPKIIISNQHPPKSIIQDDSNAFYKYWTPICRLIDLINWLHDYQHIHSENDDKYQNTGEISAQTIICNTGNDEVMENTKYINKAYTSLFHPNRFDVGFPKYEDNKSYKVSHMTLNADAMEL